MDILNKNRVFANGSRVKVEQNIYSDENSSMSTGITVRGDGTYY